MKAVGRIIRTYRKQSHMTQRELADAITKDGVNVSYRAVATWEQGVAEPNVTTFMHVCRVLQIPDFLEAYFGTNPNNPMSVLNEEGKKKTVSYIEQLAHPVSYLKESPAPYVVDIEEDKEPEEESHVVDFFSYASKPQRPRFTLRPSAGLGEYMDNSDFEMDDVDEDIAGSVDYIVTIHGDSMEPRFHDGQDVYVKKQDSLDNGDIGIFSLQNMAYIKKLKNDEDGLFLVSLNKKYDPIPVTEMNLENDEFRILGKVIDV